MKSKDDRKISSSSHVLMGKDLAENKPDGTTVVALSTSSGQFIELIDGRVVDSCDVDRIADVISIFTSYDPLQKYYLLQCQDFLVVLKKKPLCIFKTYKDVVELKIEDRLRIGHPQVVISTRNEKEIVTNFVGQLHAPVPLAVPVLTVSLNGKLQEMNARVAKVRRMVQERQNLRYKALYNFTPHVVPPDLDIECEPQVLAWGPSLPPPTTSGPAADAPLQLSCPWKKIHNGKWIVGIPVRNNSASTVNDVRLRLRQTSGGESESQLRYHSIVVVFRPRSSKGAEWTEPHHNGAVVNVMGDIAGYARAVVVAILAEPLFKRSSVVSLTGALIYRNNSQPEGETIQDVLSDEITLDVDELIQGTLVTFSSQNTASESDLVSVLSSSQCWKLCASPRHLMPPLISATFEMAGLIKIAELGCWVSQSMTCGALAGLLIIISDSELSGGGHTLLVYAREMRQVLLLVRRLQVQWKMEVCRGGSASVQDCVDSLRSELCMLRNIARAGAEYTHQEWEKIRDDLGSLELATDLSFESYSSVS
ncbi:uncharacterized protein LOC129005700 [Macrosteles quadrilineatus]|uniref:uncharacterized protein LOC129005700 n=1 Tax=Macrosteles quadrilineatus TaxID=74068 RepID=UPI0023E25D1E|nr:uncharacterized protein LOC129005700 [Macrosteles quadrilineatus]